MRAELPSAGRFAAGVLTVAAAYVYFLLYAQFAFLAVIQARGGGERAVEAAMGAMGLCGLLGSFLAARLLRRIPAARLLRAGFLLAALAAVLAALPGARAPLPPVAALVGAGVALVTVALSSALPGFFPAGRTGLGAGAGTGLAYLVCNLPGVFDGSTARQTAVAVAACAVGLLGAGRLAAPEPRVEPAPSGSRPGPALAGAVLAFLALVWLDSLAFAVIQRTDTLLARSWQGPLHQLAQGLSHALAAVLAGRWIDRAGPSRLWLAALLCFLVAVPGLQSGAEWFWPAPLYAAGVSIYSTALVVYPSLSARVAPAIPAATRAALVYGVAGWLGSGLGVGMAQHFHVVPGGFLALAALLVGAGIVAPRWRALGTGRRSIMRIGSLFLAGLAWPGPGLAGGQDPVADGRRVYVAEGCMHCHSQYVRPGHGTRDAEWWGPARGIDRSERPPMVGNRRQGPDLLNVGLRRGEAWLRLHFLDPSALVPGSRMPSYAHLFAPGDARGPALLAYLAARGAGGESAHHVRRQSWRPAPVAPADGAALFAARCTPCHGAGARGDGPLAPNPRPPGLDLRKGYFLHAPEGTAVSRRDALARVVKFGVAGTLMAGHETLSDAEVNGLVDWLLGPSAGPLP